jgi:hypothetical protein
MIIHRTKFFLALASLLVIPLVTYRCIWLLQSRRVDGVYAFEGQGNVLEQIRFPHSEIWFRDGNDTVWIKGPGGLHLQKGDMVSVRFLPGNRDKARLDTFIGIWGGTAIYGGIVLLILIAIAFHPEIIPYRSKVMLMAKRPFIRTLA